MTVRDRRALLRVRDATVQREKRPILDSANLRLDEGDLLCVVGPNGAGKSTLLRVLAGIVTPDSGNVELQVGNKWTSVAEMSRRELATRVAYVPQSVQLAEGMTVRETVAFGRYAQAGGMRGLSGDHPSVLAALREVDAAHLADRLSHTLSGGEAQRVLLARCLTTEAPAILLDEPTAALDLAHALDVMALCRRLAERGHAVCMALHSINHAYRFGTRCAVVDQGRVVGEGPPEALLTGELLGTVFGVEAVRVTAPDGLPSFDFRRTPNA